MFSARYEPKLPGKKVVNFEQYGLSPSDMLTVEIWRAAMFAHAKCRALAEQEADTERDEKHPKCLMTAEARLPRPRHEAS
jgi:hypothetical protein